MIKKEKICTKLTKEQKKALMDGLKVREGKLLMKKKLLDEIMLHISFDRLNMPMFYKENMARLDSKTLGIVLCYAIEYEKKNNQKISSVALGCYIDKNLKMA